MADEKVSTGIRISMEAMEHLRTMAKNDNRNPTTQEIEWLIDKEWERRQAGAPLREIGKHILETSA